MRLWFGEPAALVSAGRVLRGALLLALALFLGVARDARAQALRRAGDEDVTILVPPPLPPSAPQAATLSPPPDLSGRLGEVLTAVDVVIDDPYWPDVKLPSLSAMHAGDRLSYEIVRKAMEEVLATGHFADASIDVSGDAASGVRATVHVMPRKVLDRVRVEVHGAEVDADQLARDAEIEAESELVARDFPRYRSRFEVLLQRRGFPSPKVVVSTRGTDDPLRVIMVVDVNVGAPRRIERRIIYPMGGSTVEAQIAEKSYTAKAGERADEFVLTTADSELQTRVRARGFARAVVFHDVVLHKGFVVLRVRIDFGTRIETRYEGNEHFDKTALDGVLDLPNETDRTPNHLAEKLREYYVKHGFLDVEATAEDRGAPDDRVRYFVFHVIEHERVRVAGRAYPCLSEPDVKKLSEGGPRSARAIGDEIDSFLQEELPGNDLIVAPPVAGIDRTFGGPLAETSSHPSPIELDPNSVYVPETYERAVSHVQELYRAEGYLSAQVGPVQVMRRKCSKRSPAGECIPEKVPPAPDVCTYDASGVPLSVAPLEQGSTCVPDPARSSTCEARVWLRIPVKLGPRTQLWDVAFSGVSSLAPSVLLAAADTKPGVWVSNVRLEEARRRIVDAYKEEGFAFVDVKYTLESSTDRTRARVRFVVTEGERVMVREIQVRGNARTNTATILKRVALHAGQPYRASEIRKTEERIATLGAFSSVQVSLENPFVPQRNKAVIITVEELKRQYVTPLVGFSTGEGFRLSTEYGHRNLWGNAVQLTLRLQLAYIPTALIIDDTARSNYRDLEFIARLAVRATGSLVFPEIGLGPLVRAGADAILVHDLQRDFYITKIAVIPNVNWRPVNEFQITFFQSFELNNSRIFQTGDIDRYLQNLQQQGQVVTDLVRQLLIPNGQSYVFSQRLLVSWDRRDNAFNASNGTYIATGIEHVDAFPILETTGDASLKPPSESHLIKLTQTFSGYIPLPRGLRIASQTRVGANLQITQNSSTYPDRLFFMGGVDSMRGWTLNSFIPQDVVDLIEDTKDLPDAVSPRLDTLGVSSVPNSAKVTPASRPVRGGNLMVNERLELRIPVKPPFETVIFADIGNLWTNVNYPFSNRSFPVRADIGTGVRVQTPIGPLAVDYGINITRQAYEDFGALNFAIGLF